MNGDVEDSNHECVLAAKNLDEVDYKSQEVEEKLQHENDENLKRDEEKEVSNNDQTVTSVDDEDLEIKQTRCNKLLHLLKRSRMYVTALNEQVQAVGMGQLRRKKKKTVDSNGEALNNGENEKVVDNGKLGSLDLENVKENVTDVDEALFEDDDFFRKTRVTSLGFEVSDYQPLLVEGGVMRDYQLKGLQWLSTLFANGVNGILADEMGLGKTLQVIALVCNLIEQGIEGPFLVIAPLSTISNWVAEFRKFAPSVPTLLFHGSKLHRKEIFPRILEPCAVKGKKVLNVVVTSFEVVLLETKPLSKIMWPYIIVDEGHRIKNHNAQLSRVLREFNAVGKLLITGTPLQNNLSELWALLNFIIPEVFNSLEVFQSWFDIQQLELDGVKFMEENYNVNIISILQQIIMPFLLRREKKDVNIELPPKKEVLVYCPMTPLQKHLYEATVDGSIERLLNNKRQDEDVDFMEPSPKRACVMYQHFKSLERNERNAAIIDKHREKYCSSNDGPNEFDLHITLQNPQMQLRKIVNHPYLVQFPLVPGTGQLKIDEDLVKNSGKLLVVDAILSKLKARNHKVIIFSTFKMMLDILEDLARMRGYNFRRFDGSTKLEEREESILEFNTDPDVFVFFISMRAGGLGINLTGADTIIIYDSDWNPQINLQSQHRCHRIGQTRPVVIYKLCVRNTIDERIVEKGNAKRKLEKMIIQKGKFTKGMQGSDNRLSITDLQELKKLMLSTDYDSVIHSNGFVFTDEELDALLDRSDMSNVPLVNSEKTENKNDKIFKLLKYEEGQ
ncbi:UNVERIFIED_CONTAM: hypothetical protein PYX00_000331 [Menopon gallinae]|uniref:Proliferation-associated SNF2-like protein n=1 Tax=Menopon gallinae TaxID=328185 RepID=A0AAW2I9H9_9NEOP